MRCEDRRPFEENADCIRRHECVCTAENGGKPIFVRWPESVPEIGAPKDIGAGAFRITWTRECIRGKRLRRAWPLFALMASAWLGWSLDI